MAGLAPNGSGGSPSPARWNDGDEGCPFPWNEPIVTDAGSSTWLGDESRLFAHVNKPEQSGVGFVQARQIIIISEPSPFLESENASKAGVRSASPTAAAVVDSGALLSQLSDIGDLINFTRVHISSDIASRLEDLRDAPFDVGMGERRLNNDSVGSFLSYCLKQPRMHRPLITATPDGIVQGDWKGGNNERVSIRFFPGDRAWVTLRTDRAHGTIEVKSSLLLTNDSPVRLPEWM